MEKYEQISVVGEGSYGLVMKCRHKDTDQIVAIKKFLETEEDATIRKMALREIRMLKRLKHENLVAMIEVFRHRKRFYLVFEFLEGTVLDELEKMPGGMGDLMCRERIYQVTRAINYCHCNHIIHRDVKPENVLVSSLGVVKLCDFGFARLVSISGEPCTEYVATRWYRAPELLVGEVNYGAAVDIWAIGCLFAEMMTGDPLFPGESDIDQLYLIVKTLGKPCGRHQMLMSKSSQLRGMVKSASPDCDIYKNFPDWSELALDFLASCIKMDPHDRFNSEDLLKHPYFLHDRFPQRFLPALRDKVNTEFNDNPLLRRFRTEILMATDKKEELSKSVRRFQQQPPEPLRWKMNFGEGGGTKRKFNYEMFNSNNNGVGNVNNANDTLVSLSKLSQRLSVVQNSQKSGPNAQGKTKEKGSSKAAGNTNTSTAEMQMLEKSLESLARLNQQKAPTTTTTLEPNRPVSGRESQATPSSPLLPTTPPQFQSLQVDSLFNSTTTINININNNPQNNKSPSVLHPSINNISFGNNPPPKKSPNVIQSLGNNNNSSSSNGFQGGQHVQKPSQVPLLINPRTQFLKKLERNVVVDNMFGSGGDAGAVLGGGMGAMGGSSWLSGFATNMHTKKKQQQQEQRGNGRNDVFTLPNLPGATGSPNKNKKKSLPESDLLFQSSTTVTPRIQSSTSQKLSPSSRTLTLSSAFPNY